MLSLTVILLHGGAWFFGSPVTMDQYRGILPPQARVVNVAYTLGNYRRGLEDARRAARRAHARGRLVLAVGMSAGGSYAAVLAATRDADAAVAMAPVLDYPTWGNRLSWENVRVRSLAERRALSPNRLYGRRGAPLRILQGDRDGVVPLAPARRFARRWKRVRLEVAHDVDHTIPPGIAVPSVQAALRDLRR